MVDWDPSYSLKKPKRALPHILVGITHAQTCLNLVGRLSSLRDAGFQVTLVASSGALVDRLAESERVEAIALQMERGISPFKDIVSLVRLWWLLWRLKPDLTEFSTPKAGLLGNIAGSIVGVSRRVYMLRGLKLSRSEGLKYRLLLAMERLACACSHVVLCNSASLRAEALELGITRESKLLVLGSGSSNGVDVDRFCPGPSSVREQLGLSLETPVVGFVGRFTVDKGLPELIEAFAAILRAAPDTHFLLVGWFDRADDALDPRLRAQIEAHPRIHCTGFVDDTAPYYRAMDVMVLPTWREGFPNVVLEAAASGIPVITTVCTGSRDSVVPEVTGLLIPPGYPEAISEAVLKLLGDPDRRRRMGVAARAWVVDHYLTAHVMGLTVSYYKSLLDRTRAGDSSIGPVGEDPALSTV